MGKKVRSSKSSSSSKNREEEEDPIIIEEDNSRISFTLPLRVQNYLNIVGLK